MIVRTFTGGPFTQNSYLVTCARTGSAILVDAGAATPEALEAARATGASIDAIVLTHAHIDHVDGLADAKRETGAPIYLHPDDGRLYANAPMQADWFGLQMDPLPPVDHALEHDGTVRVGDCTLRVRHTPGHAPGHVILVGDGVALVGDVIFMGSIGRTDLPGGDLQTLMKSIREEILTLPDSTTLFNGHGPATTVGHERVSNPFITGVYGGSRFA
ncbi:MAG: MBL fold metallo-hydrolase [Gemmatimonadetes bacterium]|nr:MBL fold metallo-hydrolase [Gemmatimonadota bacterium]